ncbi:hypothetical protein M3Y94_00902300 [Aphelenchoides besseyi]|nr:hypothetical protein M3Y94_00902300 [Aphelenchoides besseyi]KAI6223341.1 hypothetical protein M3Y95_00879800 [Aphelenchoides besseyi]
MIVKRHGTLIGNKMLMLLLFGLIRVIVANNEPQLIAPAAPIDTAPWNVVEHHVDSKGKAKKYEIKDIQPIVVEEEEKYETKTTETPTSSVDYKPQPIPVQSPVYEQPQAEYEVASTTSTYEKPTTSPKYETEAPKPVPSYTSPTVEHKHPTRKSEYAYSSTTSAPVYHQTQRPYYHTRGVYYSPPTTTSVPPRYPVYSTSTVGYTRPYPAYHSTQQPSSYQTQRPFTSRPYYSPSYTTSAPNYEQKPTSPPSYQHQRPSNYYTRSSSDYATPQRRFYQAPTRYPPSSSYHSTTSIPQPYGRTDPAPSKQPYRPTV